MVDTSPMRPVLFTITQRMGIVTLRQAVEWYKRVYEECAPLGDLTGRELAYVNEEWAELVKQLSEAQGVPSGHLSYWLNELATGEINLAKAAKEEGKAATDYGHTAEMGDGSEG